MSTHYRPVQIPRTKLGDQLAETEAIKREMTGLLRELEEQAAGRPVLRPGAWRHHPEGWESGGAARTSK